MKKLLLSLAAVALSSGAFAVEPISTDFMNVEAFADPGTTAVDKTIDGVDYTFMGSYVSEYVKNEVRESAYLFVKGKTTAGAYFSVELPFACSKIVLKTTSGCSTNNASALNFYAGDDKLETKVLNAQNTEFTFAVPADKSAAGTIYKFESNTTKYNQQIQVITYYPATSDAAIECETESMSFATALGGTQLATCKLLVANITDNITVSCNSNAFEVPAAITVAEATTGFPIRFNGSTHGEAEGVVTFTAAGVTANLDVYGYAAEHEGTESDPLTVADVVSMASRNNETFYVKGQIGQYTCANAVDGILTDVGDAEKNVNSNITLTQGPLMIGVQLTGDIRTALNIVDTPDNVGKTVLVQGTLETYFGAPGVKNLISAEFDNAGVANIAVDDNAPAEYFNLQGLRVQYPTTGMYIVRQGAKVSKVLVK